MNNLIFDRLKEIEKIGKKNHKLIAKFLLDYQGDYRRLKMQEISDATLTSNATIVRFSQHLGFGGFPEFKIELENQVKILDGNQQISELEFDSGNYLEDIHSSLKMTSNINPKSNIFNVVNLIKNASNVDLFAMGETNAVAKDFALKLIRIGITATCHEGIHTQHFVATNSNEKTVSLGISFSGNTSETLHALKEAKEYGATTVLIAKKHTKKPSYVDHILFVECSESAARVFSTISRFSILYLLDLIYMELIQTDYEYYNNRLISTRLKESK
mgnify:CR=1 FL=1